MKNSIKRLCFIWKLYFFLLYLLYKPFNYNNMSLYEKTESKTNGFGEVEYIKTTRTKKVNAEDFIQVYLTDISGLFHNLSKSELTVLGWLWKYSTFADKEQVGSMISLNGKLFEDIYTHANIEDQTVRNCLTSLKKKSYIIADKHHRGIYYLNPKFFFKGRLTDRLKCCEVLFRYEIGDVDTSPNSDIKPNTDF